MERESGQGIETCGLPQVSCWLQVSRAVRCVSITSRRSITWVSSQTTIGLCTFTGRQEVDAVASEGWKQKRSVDV